MLGSLENYLFPYYNLKTYPVQLFTPQVITAALSSQHDNMFYSNWGKKTRIFVSKIWTWCTIKRLIQITCLAPTPFFVCLSQIRTCISNAIYNGMFVLNELRWEVVDHFVDTRIGWKIDHHCLSPLFINHFKSYYCWMFILWNRYQFYILQFRFGQILEWGGVKLDTVGLFTLHFFSLKPIHIILSIHSTEK